MKLTIFLPLLTVILFSFSLANAQQSLENVYKSEVGKCTVSFPDLFKESKKEDDISVSLRATCTNEGMMFMLHTTIYDLDEETENEVNNNKEEYLLETMKTFNSNMKGEIIASVKSENNGVEGKIATIKIGDNKIFYSVYIKEKIEYQLVVIELEIGKLDDKKINAFKNSFEIL